MSPIPRLFTVSEVSQMAEAGVLGREERVELIEGHIIPIDTPSPRNAHSIALTGHVLWRAFHHKHLVRIRLPLSISDITEPEPDFALVRREQFRPDRHPSHADLIVEVADSSLAYDRLEKASLYARQGIPDYWILNLVDRCLEVRRDPVTDPEAPFGYRYRTLQVFGESESVSAGFIPGPAIPVSRLLP